MPPKQRFTKDMLLEEAYRIYRKDGIQAVTARSIAKAVSSSTQPIFSHFKNIAEVHQELISRSVDEFCGTMQPLLDKKDALLQFSQKMLSYPLEEEHLFYSMFFTSGVPQSESYESLIGQLVQKTAEENSITKDAAKKMVEVMLAEVLGLIIMRRDGHTMTENKSREHVKRIYKLLKAEIENP